jgi:hypothetical protein
MALIAFLLLTLLRLPLSLSISIYTPPPPLAVADQHHHQEDQEQQDDSSSCDLSSPLDCADPRLFHLMMRSAIDAFPAVHFARFGRPVPGDPPSTSCDMAWRARSNSSASTTATTKDYRRFAIARDPRTCTYSVLSIGDYHSGPNARKPRPGATNATTAAPPPPPLSRSQFAAAAYLSYHGGGDRCKPMPHYMRSLLCALAEARYLNRTLVLDPTLCLAAAGMPEERGGQAPRLLLRRRPPLLLLGRRHRRGTTLLGGLGQSQLGLRLVEDTRVAPTKFSKWTKFRLRPVRFQLGLRLALTHVVPVVHAPNFLNFIVRFGYNVYLGAPKSTFSIH